MVESLLNVIKVEIQNLEVEIEDMGRQKAALSRQKSNLEDILSRYNKLWRVISSK